VLAVQWLSAGHIPNPVDLVRLKPSAFYRSASGELRHREFIALGDGMPCDGVEACHEAALPDAELFLRPGCVFAGLVAAYKGSDVLIADDGVRDGTSRAGDDDTR
jgi:hypothetical protein